jgi:phospholipid/cholesterol/gamma-HCH transport system ATP-binding protein
MTVRENLEFPLVRYFKLSQSELNSKVEEALNDVGLLDAINKMPSELSGGMQKRIGLARTLIVKPEIMLYDEPTTGLDPATSREISHYIVNLQEKYHDTSIIVTHDMECVKLTANKIVILKDGIYYKEGTYEEIISSSDEFIKSFFE